jgi:hypothetical protein
MIPVLVDPDARQTRDSLKPDIVVDAILAKINLGTRSDDASLVIGLGPGFAAGKDVHAVIETNRGHHLGRVIQRRGRARHSILRDRISQAGPSNNEEGVFRSASPSVICG